MLYLAKRHGNGVVPMSKIAEDNAIPRKFLEQILLSLKRVGYVRSRMGPGGGYELAREPSSISVAEIIRFIDGAIAPVEAVSVHFHAETPIARSPGLVGLFRDIRDYAAAKLESTTFGDLAENDRG